MSQTLSKSLTSQSVNTVNDLLELIFPSPRSFSIRLWDSSELPADTKPKFTLVIKHPGSLRRMFSPPVELSLGESFIYGDFDIEGDICDAVSIMDIIFSRQFSFRKLLEITQKLFSLPNKIKNETIGRGPVKLSGAVHSRARDRSAISYQYDVGNDFFAQWLGKRMMYSCAYFKTDLEDLDTAQEQKLDHICRKLHLKPGDRLLDIGCGWGGLSIYAAENYGAQVVGISLSEKQIEYAMNQASNKGLKDQVVFKLQDYRDVGSESFDKIVSIGMVEHVGRIKLAEYFAHAYRMLRPGGLFLNHGISNRPVVRYIISSDTNSSHPVLITKNTSIYQSWVNQMILGTNSFMQHYFFPDGELVPVSDLNLFAEQAGFEVRDIENLREHYALTLRHWVKLMEMNRDKILSVVDEVTLRTWWMYMAASAHGFESANSTVNQSLLAKPISGKSNLPLSRADLYA
ncbi:MAG TPA: cyclopropane-fatty-acyl-phospholipid synthase family protein [Anaerolineaceae bacterium]|nr:cyclopropane-fatty-acyl-phospholipid synthase family protein [Anaerolineaceae bacterium]